MDQSSWESTVYAGVTGGHPRPLPGIAQTFREEDVWSACHDPLCELVVDHGKIRDVPGFLPLWTHQELALIFRAAGSEMATLSIEEIAMILRDPGRPMQNGQPRILFHSGTLNRRALRFALEGAGLHVGAGFDARQGFPTYRLLAGAGRRTPHALVVGLRGIVGSTSGLDMLSVGGVDPRDGGTRASYPIQYQVTAYARETDCGAIGDLAYEYLTRIRSRVDVDQRLLNGVNRAPLVRHPRTLMRACA
jgi:hypothetical protein